MIPEFIIKKGSIKELEKVYHSFRTEFAHENKETNYLKELMEKGKYILLFFQKKQTLEDVGYAFIFESIKNNFLWIDYIATFPEYRNKGFGNIFMKKILSTYAKNSIGVFFEIDRFFDTLDEKKLIEKRLKFYLKFNAKKLNVDYCYESEHKLIEMDLYFIPIKTNIALDGSQLKCCLIEFFDYYYDVKTRKILNFPYKTAIKTQHFI